MAKIRTVLGFDMETDIGSWTSFYDGFKIGTPRILEILKRRGITATFYFTADAAEHNPEWVKAVRDAGHEIGCHTLFHETIGDPLFEIPGMMPVLPEEVEHRIELATERVEKIAGVRPTSWRCPRLWGSTVVCNTLERLGYKSDASYPMYFYRERLTPYHPAKEDWTKECNLSKKEYEAKYINTKKEKPIITDQEIIDKFLETKSFSIMEQFFHKDRRTIKKILTNNGINFDDALTKKIIKVQKLNALSMEILNEFSSVKEAIQYVLDNKISNTLEENVIREAISQSNSKGRVSYGYRWKFIYEE